MTVVDSIITPENRAHYFQVALANSLVLFGFDLEDLRVLIQRKREDPFKNAWILPSKYVHPDESFEQSIKLLTMTSIQSNDVYLEQLTAYGKVYRNPIGRVVNIPFYGLKRLTPEEMELAEKRGYLWVKYHEVPDLAYDHNEIIDYGKERLKRRVKRRPVGFHSLPPEFTLNQLQTLYAQALNKTFDKRNFRKKIFKSQLLIDTGNTTEAQAGKISRLYRFDEDAYEKMSLKGYDFLF